MMKRMKLSLLLEIALIILSSGTAISGETTDITSEGPVDKRDGTEMTDSLQGDIMTLSEEDGFTFFNGIVPCSPQAASLARYAEYPVSHTTGIPDITVPVFEIALGGYVLPVSVSYHASGARVDQMPTCVGLGWTLNAGGAISRTILGKPDLYYKTAYGTDYDYYDRNTLQALIKSVANGNSGSSYSHLSSIIGDSPEWDTESDRYTYNVGGKTGVFRYSVEDHGYLILNNTNDTVTSSGCAREGATSFCLKGTDGVEYRFREEECTGVTSYFNETPFVSTWYVSEINTPYGDITFTYMNGFPVDVHYFDVTATSGRRLEMEVYEDSSTWKEEYYFHERYRIQKRESPYTVSYGQKLLRKIEWDGNRMEFDYVEEHRYETTPRLTEIRVYNAAGDLRKKVTFDNSDNWPTGSTLTGRRLLTSISDSENGIWRFEYNKKRSLPAWTVYQGNPACCSDLWGYMNTTTPSLSHNVFTESQINWLKEGADGTLQPYTVGSRNRQPDLECTKAGVLTKVVYPTGGWACYDYELNGLGRMLCGGLRVRSITVFENDGATARKSTFDYSGISFTAEDPERLMNYWSWERMRRNKAYSDVMESDDLYPTRFRTSVPFPIHPAVSTSCPVLYNCITETRIDGSRVVYTYDEKELPELFGTPSDPNVHPSLFQQSVWDFGNREPLLTSRTVFDSKGNVSLTETYTYDRITRKRFSTGLRVACPYYEYEVPRNSMYPNEGVTTQLAAKYNMVQYEPSVAFRRVCVLREKTVTDASGYMKVTRYTYDPDFRTMQPRSVVVEGSDLRSLKTEYTYPFDHTDAVSAGMVARGQTDSPVEVSTYSGTSLISKSVTGYGLFNGRYHPVSSASWGAPTSSSPQAPPPELPERERVSAYNSKGRPLSITVNGTDETSFTWNTAGNLLMSSTAPGGLTTTYTHRPLFGLSSVKLPNGHTTSYSYNSAGMLSSVSDGSGTTESYAYSLAGHPTMNSDGNSVTAYRHLDAEGTRKTLTRQYHSRLGLPSTLMQGGLNTSGKYVFSTTGYDALGRPTDRILPGVGGTSPSFRTYTQILADARATYGEEYVKTQTSYDALDRPVRTTTPGDAWQSAGKGKTTHYISNAANSVRLYRAPMDRISLVEDGYYAAKTLQGVRTVDEDGNEMTVYTDRLGRKVLERRGPESQKGQNDTYFVHNALGQLRYVLSPGYELSGYKDKFAYEYRYDVYGNVVKKFIPGAGYTQYWYDRAGRLAFMQDPNLRERNLHRFFVYDRAGRMAIQGVSGSCNRSIAVNFADYKGGTQGFASTGYTLEDASRLQQVTLETVNYYDTYAFAPVLSSALVRTGTVSAMGLQTGSAVYGSDRSRTVSAFYYDAKGNIIESREVPSLKPVRTTVNTYTYTGQPLKSTVTEGTLTTVTENTYDASSGLLTATDVTVNGVKQRVSAVEYDDLGRIVSVTRGTGGKGGKVGYKYNIHGQTTEIKGPGFSQNLYYTDGPGKKLYNGSVSAMTWTMGSDTRVRGYKYAYNGYGWLTAAEYGENADLGSNPNRYTERFLGFMPNGGIRRLQRHGLKADGVYGKVDNLHISYDGNRITTVLEDADPVTQVGSMDYPGGKKELAFGYNEWGALVSDGSRGITDISYDRFGNPLRISYTDGAYTENVYSAAGEKLKATHATSLNGTVTGKTTTEYRGNVIYRDGKVDMVLFPGGYATINGTAVTFHYYTQDYLGNNRAVINGSTGAVEQTTAYYPYGGIIADLGNPHGGQPYKFGGKELVTANGLNEYDFGARSYYSAVPGFIQPDQMAEKYSWLSPYLYCANNPVNAFDPDGNVIVFVNGFHMGDGGQSKYWNGIDYQIMRISGDKQALYYDGALGGVTGLGKVGNIADNSISNLNAQDRIEAGFQKGYAECQTILNMSRENSSSVKFVSHSMGGAYTKGFIQGMMQFANDNKIDISGNLEFEVDFAPFQPLEQTPVIEKTIVFQHSFDGVAGDKPIQGATNIVTHKNPSYNLFNAFLLQFKEHSISSFSDDISNFWEKYVK